MRTMSWVLTVVWPLALLGVVVSIRHAKATHLIQRRVSDIGHQVKEPHGLVSSGSASPTQASLRERWSAGPTAAALRLRVSEYILFRTLSFVLPFIVGFVVRGLTGGIILGLAGLGGLTMYFRYKQRRWLREAEESLPEFLRGVTSVLRAGSSLSQAMALVVEDMSGPLGDEVRRILRREALGFGTNDTLLEMARRIPSRDLSLAVMAITIQREVGGSLADLLDNIIRTVVERQRLKTEIRILTAQGRYSGWLLTFLPFILGLMLWFTDPTYMGAMITTEIGAAMLAAAVISVTIGGVIINKLVQSPEM